MVIVKTSVSDLNIVALVKVGAPGAATNAGGSLVERETCFTAGYAFAG